MPGCAGFALYGADGRLRWYRSRNYGTMGRLKKAAYVLVGELEGLERVVVEGGGGPSEPWVKEAERRSIPVVRVHACWGSGRWWRRGGYRGFRGR